jgi:aspartate/methionine/tyrosine aminotransferase
VPGSGFGYHDENAGYFRIVFLPEEEVLAEAFDKIAEFMSEQTV